MGADVFDGKAKAPLSIKIGVDTADAEEAIKNAPATPADRRKQLMAQRNQMMQQRKKKQLSSGKLIFKDDDERMSATLSPGSARSGSISVFDGGRSPKEDEVKDLINERMSLQMSERESASHANMTASEKHLLAAGIKPIFDPSPAGKTINHGPAQVDLSDLRSFINSPLPRGQTVECCITRNKRGMKGKMYPVYELYLENPKKMLLCAKKRTKNKTSNYLISMDKNQMDKESASYMGKVRSNFVGTEFTIYDAGVNPKNLNETEESAHRTVREELGAVLYESNILGSKGPRRMTVVIPVVDPNTGRRDVIRPRHASQQISARLKSAEGANLEGLQSIINKDAQWNEGLGAYVLDFRSRVTMASVKNFQLIDERDENDIILQFGRVAKETFTMDISFPLSPLQAFSICLTSFDYKLALE